MRRSRRLLLGSALLLGLLALPADTIAQTPLSSDAFLERLDRATELARLDGVSPSAGRMSELRAALDLPVEVVIGDWSTQIPQDPILESLSGSSRTDFERASERLHVLSRSLSDAAAGARRPRADIAEALAAAFRGVVAPRQDPLTAVLEALGDAFQSILRRLGDAVGRAGDALAWLVVVAILLGVGVGVLRSGVVPDRKAPLGIPRHGIERIDWMARGEAALRAGDLHEAVRAFYVAILVVLAARGIVSDAPTLTAGEARVAVRRSRPELFPTIEQATDTYERVVYGGAAPADLDVQRLREATMRVRRP